MSASKNRTAAITILVILAVIAGLVAVLDVLRYLGLLPIASLGTLDFFGFSFIGAIFAGVSAAIWFWAASKLWNLDEQGWLFASAISVINIIFYVLAVLGRSTFSAVLPALAINVLVLILTQLPSTKAAFGK